MYCVFVSVVTILCILAWLEECCVLCRKLPGWMAGPSQSYFNYVQRAEHCGTRIYKCHVKSGCFLAWSSGLQWGIPHYLAVIKQMMHGLRNQLCWTLSQFYTSRVLTKWSSYIFRPALQMSMGEEVKKGYSDGLLDWTFFTSLYDTLHWDWTKA